MDLLAATDEEGVSVADVVTLLLLESELVGLNERLADALRLLDTDSLSLPVGVSLIAAESEDDRLPLVVIDSLSEALWLPLTEDDSELLMLPDTEGELV